MNSLPLILTLIVCAIVATPFIWFLCQCAAKPTPKIPLIYIPFSPRSARGDSLASGGTIRFATDVQPVAPASPFIDHVKSTLMVSPEQKRGADNGPLAIPSARWSIQSAADVTEGLLERVGRME